MRRSKTNARWHDGPEFLVGFSQDGRLLVTRSADEKIVKEMNKSISLPLEPGRGS
jgi:hypothetical protein